MISDASSFENIGVLGHLAQAIDEAIPEGATGFDAARAVAEWLDGAGFKIVQRELRSGVTQPLMGVQRPEDVVEQCAQIAENYQRDSSFDDSVIGTGEHTANQINIANAIRQAHTGQPQEGDR